MLSLFDVQGRTGRLGYWRVQLLCMVCVAAIWTLGLFAMLGMGPIGAILFVPAPAIIVIGVAAWIRRLHDRGKGLWWAFFFLVSPWILLGIARVLIETASTTVVVASLPFSLGAVGLSLWGLIEAGILRGQPGANRYGDPPPAGH